MSGPRCIKTMQSVSLVLGGADHGVVKQRLPVAASWAQALRLGMGPDVRTRYTAGVQNSSTGIVGSQSTSERKAKAQSV